MYICNLIVYDIFFPIATKMVRTDPDPAGSLINWPPGSGSRSVSQDYGPADPDPSEINIYGSTTLLGREEAYSKYLDERKFL